MGIGKKVITRHKTSNIFLQKLSVPGLQHSTVQVQVPGTSIGACIVENFVQVLVPER